MGFLPGFDKGRLDIILLVAIQTGVVNVLGYSIQLLDTVRSGVTGIVDCMPQPIDFGRQLVLCCCLDQLVYHLVGSPPIHRVPAQLVLQLDVKRGPLVEVITVQVLGIPLPDLFQVGVSLAQQREVRRRQGVEDLRT